MKYLRFKTSATLCLVFCLGSACLASGDAARLDMGTSKEALPASLALHSFDFHKLLGEPPANDSQTHRDEIAALLKLQNERTPEQAKMCKIEADADVFVFTDVLGPSFNSTSLTKTAALMAEVKDEAKTVSKAAKKIWDRPRPFMEDARVHPAVNTDKEKDGGFPSSHATRAMTWATLLAEIFPAQKEALMQRAEKFGNDRVLAGAHYPTDVAAGNILGTEIARRLLNDTDFQLKFAAVRAECTIVKPSVKLDGKAGIKPTTDQ